MNMNDDVFLFLLSVGVLFAALIFAYLLRASRMSHAQHARLADALAQITRSPELSSGILEDAAKIIARTGCATLNTSRVGIWRISKEDAILRNITTYSMSTSMSTGTYGTQPDFNISTPGAGEYARLLASERQVAIENAAQPNVLTDILAGYGPQICAMLDAPIRVEGKLAGVLCIEQDRCAAFPVKREWSIAEQDFASSLADFMAIALTSAEHRMLADQTEEMMNNLPGMVYRYRNDPPNLTMTFASCGSLPLIGYPPEELVGGSMAKIMETMVHPDDLAAMGKQHEETLFRGLPLESTFRIRLKDGSEKWLWERIRIIETAEDGRPYLFEGFCTDVTEQRRLKNQRSELQSHILNLQGTVLQTIAELVEYRDTVTGGHVERTRLFLERLLESMAMRGIYTEEFLAWEANLFLMSSQLHDVGKIAIRDEILMKPGALTDDEFEQMKQHTVLGVEIIDRISEKSPSNTFLEYAKVLAGTHHERWDGTGYPYGLKAGDIPLMGRLMAIADVYDALRNDRPYKKSLSHENAVNILRQGSGTQFDPELIQVFLSCEENFKSIQTGETRRMQRSVL